MIGSHGIYITGMVTQAKTVHRFYT